MHLDRPDAVSGRLVGKPCFAWSADGFEFRSDVTTGGEGAGVVGRILFMLIACPQSLHVIKVPPAMFLVVVYIP